MPTIRRETVSVDGQSQTVALTRYPTDKPGKQYEYTVEDDDTGDRMEGPVYNREAANRLFRETVSDIKRGMASGSHSRSPSLPGFGGGSRTERGPSIPGMGPVDTDNDGESDDDDQPFLFGF